MSKDDDVRAEEERQELEELKDLDARKEESEHVKGGEFRIKAIERDPAKAGQ